MKRAGLRNFFTAALVFISFLIFHPSVSAQAPDGEKLFKDNCTQCHTTGTNKIIGPGLFGISERQDKPWLHKWIKNSQALVKAGDPYSVKIFEEHGKIVMPNQNLNDAEIDAVLAYIDAEGNKAPATIATGQQPSATESAEEGYPLPLIAIIVLLIIFAVVLHRIKNSLEHAVLIREGKPIPVPLPAERQVKNWIRGNKKLIAVFLILFSIWGSVKGWNALAAIGISQNYQPEQPIKYSHKLHAGINKINCQYCHLGAEKGRHANIPSANLCMNCHKYIQEGPVYGKEEIAKIYAALDYDPATGIYGPNQKPIKWVQVHNLPDLAYFNHSQHVKVGQLECQTCHGNIEEMDVVKQYSNLTMAWCIDCHRTTEVKMANGYYSDYHKKLIEKFGPEAKMTVDKIGGTECSRCHY